MTTTTDRPMKVLILCGGLGTRLSGVGIDVPKPMIPIGGKPIVWHIMKGFAHWGYCDFVLCLGYRSELFKQYFLNLSMMVNDVTLDVTGATPPVVHQTFDEQKWRVTLAETGFDSLTGSRVKRGGMYVPADDDLFAVTYGDGVCDVDFRKVVAFHRSHGKLATVTAVHPPGQFGELTIGTRGRVATFQRKAAGRRRDGSAAASSCSRARCSAGSRTIPSSISSADRCSRSRTTAS